MQHMAAAAAATALFIGAGSGAITTMNSARPPAPVEAQNPMVAGAAMLASESIYASAAHSPEHATLVAELKAAGLTGTLQAPGDYTVFAPTDTAYAALGQARVAAMLKPDAAAKDARYLIVKGRYDSATLLKLINENGGQVRLKTVEGGTLTAMLNGPSNIALIDGKGNVADISIYDIYQNNGVIQVIDKVVLPG
ncbi:MAG TPA: fasciclin domain-containing protein [Rhizomicrobium sp.]|nr:fasciclin domain-containing protein [Rhizomicrobium sp.]